MRLCSNRSENFAWLCSLSHLADMMNKKAVSLTDRLALAAKEGGLINMSKLTIDLTLDVISTAAFGYAALLLLPAAWLVCCFCSCQLGLLRLRLQRLTAVQLDWHSLRRQLSSQAVQAVWPLLCATR